MNNKLILNIGKEISEKSIDVLLKEGVIDTLKQAKNNLENKLQQKQNLSGAVNQQSKLAKTIYNAVAGKGIVNNLKGVFNTNNMKANAMTVSRFTNDLMNNYLQSQKNIENQLKKNPETNTSNTIDPMSKLSNYLLNPSGEKFDNFSNIKANADTLNKTFTDLLNDPKTKLEATKFLKNAFGDYLKKNNSQPQKPQIDNAQAKENNAENVSGYNLAYAEDYNIKGYKYIVEEKIIKK